MIKDEVLLDIESKGCFDYFWYEANVNKNSNGLGLIRDRYPGGGNIASIASVGFGLTAIPIGVERGWITYSEGFERTNQTLETLLYRIYNKRGFFFHFVTMDEGKRAYDSEISIIDTAIALCGALTAGSYFGGEIKKKSQYLYDRIDWPWFWDPARNQFYMAFSPERGFCGWWDFYAEQLMLYFLAAGSSTYPINGKSFYGFKRNHAAYRNSGRFINSWFGSLFTHQFSHAWFDLRGRRDRDNVDWWENSITASLANRQFCIDNSAEFKTFSEYSWGITACDGPFGYSGKYGSAPSAIMNDEHVNDGTVPPCGAAGSIVFTPEYSIQAIRHYYANCPDLLGKYGLKDAYNIDVNPVWYSSDVVGIDKGITLLMIENFRTGLVWDAFMYNPNVNLGLERTGVVYNLVDEGERVL